MRQNTAFFRNSSLIQGAAILCGIALFVTGCSDEAGNINTLPAPGAPGSSTDITPSTNEPAPSENTNSGLPKTGELNIEGQSIIFSPETCLIQAEDILVQAPGINRSSMQAAFLGLDVPSIDGEWHGEARIELGVNDAFSSSDDFYTTFLNPQENYELHISGNEITLTAEFRNSDSASVGQGTLFVRC